MSLYGRQRQFDPGGRQRKFRGVVSRHPHLRKRPRPAEQSEYRPVRNQRIFQRRRFRPNLSVRRRRQPSAHAPLRIDYGEDGAETYRYEMEGDYISQIEISDEDGELNTRLEIFYE